jgi:4-amino-4-deoxychorismate lyase
MENLLALEEAERRGFGETIRLNERQEIVSASMANVFWIKNKKIFTPTLETGCLAGTTRAFLLDNFAVCEIKASLNKIIEADEIFLTSARVGICRAEFVNLKKRDFSIIPELKKFLDLQSVKS